MSRSSERRRRPLVLVAATVLALALIPSSAAMAAANYSISTSNSQRGDFAFTSASVFGSASDVHNIRLVIRRNGNPVASAIGQRSEFGTNAFASAGTDVPQEIGDQLEIYNPSTASSPAKSITFTGKPSLDSCPIGSKTFGGRIDPGTTINFAGAFSPSAGSGDPNASNPGTAKQNGSTYTVTLQRALKRGDSVFVSASRQIEANFTYNASRSADAGSCTTPPAPGGGTTTPGPTTTTVTPLNGVVEPLDKSDVKQEKNGKTVDVRVTCSAASTIPCSGTAGVQTVRRFANVSAVASAKKKAKPKRVTLATKKFTVAPGATKTIKLKLKKPAMRLLRRSEERRVGKECRSRWSPYH